MEKHTSPKEHALEIAISTMNKVLEGNYKTSSILRACLAVSSMIGDFKNREWIIKELSGYSNNEESPSYRNFSGKFTVSGVVSTKAENFSVKHPVHRIEYVLDSKENLGLWDDNFKKYHQISPEWCHTILSSSQERCLMFLTDTMMQLQYSGMISSLIDNIQKSVDIKIKELNQEISSELESIFVNLSSENPVDWSAAAHSCRRVLKIISNEVFPPMDELYVDSAGKSHVVKEDDYKNRLLAFFDQNRIKGLVKTEINILSDYLENLIDLAGKGEHSKISRFESDMIAIHTYLILSEVIKIRETLDKKK